MHAEDIAMLWSSAEIDRNLDLFALSLLSARPFGGAADDLYSVTDADGYAYAPPTRPRPCFLGELADRPAGRFVWEIVRPAIFVPTFESGLPAIHIAALSLLDYASAPRITWPIIPLRDGVYDAAAAAHDIAVRRRTLLGISLFDCHRIFGQALDAQAVPRVRRDIMLAAVCAFNWIAPGPGDGATPPRLLRRVRKHEERLQ